MFWKKKKIIECYKWKLSHFPLNHCGLVMPYGNTSTSTLFQVMVLPLLSAKLVPEPMLLYCYSHPKEQRSVKFESKYNNSHSTKNIWKSAKCWPYNMTIINDYSLLNIVKILSILSSLKYIMIKLDTNCTTFLVCSVLTEPRPHVPESYHWFAFPYDWDHLMQEMPNVIKNTTQQTFAQLNIFPNSCKFYNSR